MVPFYRRRFVPILFGISIATSLYFVYASGKPAEERNMIDRVVLAIVSPIQDTVGKVGDGITSLWTDYIYLYDQKSQLDRLNAENEKLREEIAILRPNALAKEECEKSLAYQKAAEPRKLIPARVVARSVTPFFQVTRIRVEAQGIEIKEGMPVVAADGVVGTVRHVFGGYADVLLLPDRERKVAVMAERTRAFGTLEGLGKDQPYLTRLQFLVREDRAIEEEAIVTAGESIIQDGDIIVTSGLDRVFPPGLLVGRVKRIGDQNLKKRQDLFVQPAVDFNRIRQLFIDVSPNLAVPLPVTPRPSK